MTSARKIFCLLTLIILAMTQAFGFSDPAWRLYPSFDKQLVKIIDTPRITYFLGLSELYDLGTQSHHKAVPSLFRHDKEGDATSAAPLTDLAELNNSVILTAEYNPHRNYLAVVYADGVVDMVYDDGRTRHLTALRDMTNSGSKGVNSLTFDPTNPHIWLATDFGYIKLSETSGTILESGNIGHTFTYICRIGDKTVAFDSERAWEKDADTNARSIDDFRRLSFMGSSLPDAVFEGISLKSPLAIMPLGDNSFGFISAATNGNGYSVNVARPDGSGNWTYEHLANSWLYITNQAQRVVSATETCVSPNKEGYFLLGVYDCLQLTENGEIKSRPNLTESTHIFGTWDFSDFRFYAPRTGFYSRMAETVGGVPQWGEPSVVVPTSGPSSFICEYMEYHPTRGMLLATRGSSAAFEDFSSQVPLLLDGLKDGEWTHYAPAYILPDFIASDSEMLQAYSYKSESYPINKPRGLAIDPLFPDHVYFGSVLGGVARLDLANPGEPPLHLTHPGNQFATWPGSVVFAPLLSWDQHCSFSNLDFDPEGNLWSIYFNLDSKTTNNELWYWTPEARSASAHANTDPTSFRPWGKIELKGAPDASNNQRLLALKSEANRNIVLACPNTWGSPIVIYSHKGTLGDTSDDKETLLKNPRTQSGTDYKFERILSCMEDPLTGKVWMGHDNGLFCFYPSEALEDPSIVELPRISSQRFSIGSDILCEGMEVTAMCMDEYGGKWFGTNGAGLWGVNAEETEITAHFTSSNSPLPSNSVFGLAWNPGSKTLMISTDLGLAEAQPERGGAVAASVTDNVYPNPVYPDYFGRVSISVASSGETVTIVSPEGKDLINLGYPTDGKVEWNPRAQGASLPSGRYKAVGSVSRRTHGEILVP